MIPPCPKIVETLALIARCDSTDLEDAVSVLNRDQTLAAEVLAAAKSPVFDTPSDANFLQDAIDDRGIDWLRSTVTSLLLKRDFDARRVPEVECFWESIVGRALIIAHLAREFRVAEVYEAYSYGIFRDCGAVLMLGRYREYRLWQDRAERSGSSDLLAFERAVYGVDHSCLSTLWAKQWMLPEHIWLSISMHHVRADHLAHPLDHCDITHRLVAIGALADVNDGMRRNPKAHEHWKREQQFALSVLGITESQLNALNEQADILLTFP